MYWAYCIFWGVKGAIQAKTASDYFIAGRALPIWVFVLAATATSFSGWTFMGHPGLVYRDGFQYAYASFYAITIPFTGVMFLKRQWILGKRFGFVTPGEMFSDYFKSDTMRILTVIVALVFSVPYLGVQLRASGFLFNVLTDGLLGVEVGMWMLSLVVIIYVASGGLKAVAYVDTVQCILLAGGILAIGLITLNAVGGFDALNQGIASLAAADTKLTPDGYSHYIAIPGVIQFVASGPKAVGGAWTGIMCLTYMFALMGIQSAPAFTMWSFSNKNPRPFAPQQVWASSFGIGFILAHLSSGAVPISISELFHQAGEVIPTQQNSSHSALPTQVNSYHLTLGLHWGRTSKEGTWVGQGGSRGDALSVRPNCHAASFADVTGLVGPGTAGDVGGLQLRFALAGRGC